MTETTFSPPLPTSSSASRLERPRDAAFRGVCAALARATGTDLVLWRVLIVILTFFGGLGIVLYLAGIVAIPREDEERSIADRLLHGPDRHLERRQILLVVVLVVLVVGMLKNFQGVVALTVAGGLGYLWWRARTPVARVPVEGDPDSSDVPRTQPGDSVGGRRWPDLDKGAAGDPGVRPEPVTRRVAPPRPRSPLSGVSASLALVVAGVLLLVGQGDVSIPAEVVLAGALGVVGLGLVVGSFLGRAPWLVVLAGVLGLALLVTVAVRPALDAGIGDRTWTPSGAATYRLGVGDATLDLTGLAVRESGIVGIDARVDVGHLLVLVPAGLRVAVHAKAGLGDVLLEGKDHNGRRVDESVNLGPAGAPQVRLDLGVRTGAVEVRRG